MDTTPREIGRYQVEKTLGNGAMGVVYLAHDPVIDRRVAIKLVHAHLLSVEEREEFLPRFAREARAAGRCAHANIVAIYDFAEHLGSPYLVMEHVRGMSLADKLKRQGPFAPPVAVAIIRQVLSALHAAHEAGIVHRDVKPANILLTDEGQVKMTDFGIARLETMGITMTGVMVGTPRYMSPEQINGETVDRRTDLFSTGIVLYELLGGRTPFDGPSFAAIVHKIMTEDPPDPRALNPAVPASVAAAIRKSLARDRAARFPTAAAMAAALDAEDDDTRLGGAAMTDDATVIGRRPATPTAAAPTAAAVSAPPAAERERQPDNRSVIGPRPAALSEAEQLRAERALATFVGPIARILAKRAAASAASPEAFWRELAEKLDKDSERQAFLRMRLG